MVELSTDFKFSVCKGDEAATVVFVSGLYAALKKQSIRSVFDALVQANSDSVSLASNLVKSLGGCSVRDMVLNWQRTEKFCPTEVFDRHTFFLNPSFAEKRAMVLNAKKLDETKRACAPEILRIDGIHYVLPVLRALFEGCAEALSDFDFAVAGHKILNKFEAEEIQREQEFQAFAFEMMRVCAIEHEHLPR
ncbi:MAG: hypothetical protein JNL76_04290 [Alphaproteobacteria bacterium]|nr:hypothetical protein [Alphaproteobacteria bacterium]